MQGDADAQALAVFGLGQRGEQGQQQGGQQGTARARAARPRGRDERRENSMENAFCGVDVRSMAVLTGHAGVEAADHLAPAGVSQGAGVARYGAGSGRGGLQPDFGGPSSRRNEPATRACR